MKLIKYIFAILTAFLLMFALPTELEAKRAAKRAKTTAVSKSKKTGRSAKSGKSSAKSKYGSSSKSKNKKKRAGKKYGRKSASRRSVWHPFATFESRVTPTPYYVPSDSIASLRLKAASGNREAQYLLGCSHFERRVRYTPTDSADILAAKYWHDAAVQGHIEAIGNYAYCLRTGRGVQTDTLAAIDYYVSSILKGNNRLEKLIKRNAEHGGGMDSYILARAIELGYKNTERGKDTNYYDELAISNGFTPALIAGAEREIAAGNTDHAIELLRSIHNPDDRTINRILDMLSKAGTGDLQVLRNLADTDYPEAQLALSEMLIERGESAEGGKWMYRAAQNGSDAALNRIVVIQTTPGSSLYDPYQAYLWLDTYTDSNAELVAQKALELTNDTAFANYAKGLVILDSDAENTPDYASALNLFLTSTTPGADAMTLLCIAKTDKKSKAHKQLKQLASKGIPLAPFAYSLLNEKDAMKSLRTAASAGDVAASNRLGVILCRRGKFEDARKILLPIHENSIMTRDAAMALTECDDHLNEKR